jgi:hypothetical protein
MNHFIVLLFLSLTEFCPALIKQELNLNPLHQKLRRDLAEIVKDPRFTQPDHLGWLKGFFESLIAFLEKLWQPIKWIIEYITRSYLGKADTPVRLAHNTVAIVLFILLLFIIIYYLSRFLQSNKINRSNRSEKSLNHTHVIEKLEHQAEEFALRGNFGEALRMRYQSCLEHLKYAGILPEGIRLSDRENLQRLRLIWGAQHDSFYSFQQLVGLFQEKWYGLRDCRAEDYRLAGRLINIINTHSTRSLEDHV